VLASNETLKALPEPPADAWRKELRWPCRFMTDAQLQSVMNQVISAHMGELLIRGFTEAFWEAMIQPMEHTIHGVDLSGSGTVRSLRASSPDVRLCRERGRTIPDAPWRTSPACLQRPT
jgi:hypothetical protein